jgi:hypothetical protein
LFCVGDLVWSHAGLQEFLASITVAAPPQQQQPQPQQQPQQLLGKWTSSSSSSRPADVLYLQAVLRVLLLPGAGSSSDMEHAGAAHLLHGFCHDNTPGKRAVALTVVPAGGVVCGRPEGGALCALAPQCCAHHFAHACS